MAGLKKIAAGLTALVVAVALAGAFAAPSSAGDDPFLVRVAKEKDGKYKKLVSAPAFDQKEDFFFRVKSKSNQVQHLDFRGSSTTSAYKIRWYLGNDDVTDDVSNLGRDFNLKARKSKIFELSAKPDNGGSACFYGEASDDNFASGLTSYVSVDNGTC